MTSLVSRLRDFQDTLDALARRHGVPGATMAVSKGDELLDFATGVLNVNTGVPTTTDSIFQIGSNTKVFTSTLVMQLVDAGQVKLDDRVRKHLPGFSLADGEAARRITVRQLLTHTSGIQGDYFRGFGQGEDSVAQYVDSLADIDLVHPPGKLWSYCNSAFVVAGRLAEVVTGVTYSELLRTRICEPLGLRRTTVLADEMLAQRCAVGHAPGPDGRPMVPPKVIMEYAHVPAGSRTTSTAAELVAFVQMHLHGGLAPDGDRVLSAEAVREMQEVQAIRPLTTTAPQTQGVGWLMDTWGGKRVIGHGGGTIGQTSFLHALPEDELVMALLTNSGSGALLWRDLGRHVFEELANVEIALPLKAPAQAPDLPLERYVGTYERLGFRHVVTEEDGALFVRTELSGPLAELRGSTEEPPVRLHPIDKERFAVREDGIDDAVAFLEFERGRPRYLFAGRVSRRVRARPAARKG